MTLDCKRSNKKSKYSCWNNYICLLRTCSIVLSKFFDYIYYSTFELSFQLKKLKFNILNQIVKKESVII